MNMDQVSKRTGRHRLDSAFFVPRRKSHGYCISEILVRDGKDEHDTRRRGQDLSFPFRKVVLVPRREGAKQQRLRHSGFDLWCGRDLMIHFG